MGKLEARPHLNVPLATMVVAARPLVERVRIFSDPITLVAVLGASDIIDPDVALVGSIKTVVGVQVCVRFDGTLAVFEFV